MGGDCEEASWLTPRGPGARPEGSGHDFFTRGEQRENRGHRGLAVRASRQYASRMQTARRRCCARG